VKENSCKCQVGNLVYSLCPFLSYSHEPQLVHRLVNILLFLKYDLLMFCLPGSLLFALKTDIVKEKSSGFGESEAFCSSALIMIFKLFQTFALPSWFWR
jgi:hypothetical protein